MINVLQHGHVEIPLPARRNKRQEFKIKRMKNRDIRSDTDAEIIGHKTGSYLILINFKGNIRILSDALKQLVDNLAETTALFKNDLFVWQCFFQMNLRFFRKRMSGWNDNDQILLGNRNKLDQWFVVKFGTEADVIFLFFQSVQDITCQNLVTEQIEIDLLSFIGSEKAADDLGNKIHAKSTQEGNVDLAFSFTCKLETVHRRVQPVQGFFHILQKRLAIFGERNIPSVFFK